MISFYWYTFKIHKNALITENVSLSVAILVLSAFSCFILSSFQSSSRLYKTYPLLLLTLYFALKLFILSLLKYLVNYIMNRSLCNYIFIHLSRNSELLPLLNLGDDRKKVPFSDQDKIDCQYSHKNWES